MPTYAKTVSFTTRGWAKEGGFNSEKDDSKLNSVLRQIQGRGAKICDVKVSLGGSFWTILLSGTVYPDVGYRTAQNHAPGEPPSYAQDSSLREAQSQSRWVPSMASEYP